MQSIRHSLLPSSVRNQPIPSPVHSDLRAETSLAAALASVLAVELAISTRAAPKEVSASWVALGDVLGRGRNQSTPEVEEASVGPVARGEKQDEQQDRAVHAWPVEEIRAYEEEEDEGW